MREEKTVLNALLPAIWIVFAVLCMAYGVLILSAGSGTLFHYVWFVLAVVCAVLAVFAKLRLWSMLPSVLKTAIVVFLALGFTVFAAVEGCILSAFNQTATPGLDYIVVLGAQVRSDGPSRVLRFRLDQAIEYLESSPETLCIVSGGQGYNEPVSEAQCMAEYLTQHGISTDRIIMEDKSESTQQNIAFSKAFLPENAEVGIVTNNFHLFRALQTARCNGLKEVRGIAADSLALYLPNNLFREFFGEVKFLINRIMKLKA